MDTDALRAPFDPARVSWRVGSTKGDKSAGLALAYIDARDVMDRLDTVCGPANWQDRYEFHGARTVCYLSVRIGDEWITKADGAGDSDVEAEKGSISDALKRAAVKWGIGRYLYELPKVWVDLKPVGRSFAIKEGQDDKLARALRGAATAADLREPAQPAEEPRRQSISERAAPKAPAPKSDLCQDMIERLAGVQTMSQLRTMATGEEWTRDIAKLTDAEATEVRKAYGQAQREIGQNATAATP